MRLLSVLQPWATLLSRGAARFVVRDDATDYRGTVAIHASDVTDPVFVERMQTDPEFAEHMAEHGFSVASDVEALPRSAIVGLAVIADLWSLTSLEEVATEVDAILIGDVVDASVFWELAESVEIPAIAAQGAAFDAVSADVATAVREAARRCGALFDEDELVFWPVAPTTSLAALIGDDALGDREITRRVWAYVVEHDLQDAEDPAYVYLDDALRDALDCDDDGMPTSEFTARIDARMLRIAE